MIDTPELDKQLAVIKSGKAGTVQEFYDWLVDQGYVLARYSTDDDGEGLYATFVQPEQLMADFFGIDRNKIEAERRALLDEIRSRND